jgi:hypothetical protein
MTNDERRQHRRHKVTIAVGMQADAAALISGTMEDVSLGGALIRAARPPKEGGEVSVVVLRDGEAPLSLPATVCRVIGDGVGIAWGELDGEGQAFVASVARDDQ